MVDPISRDENGSVLKAHLTTAQDLTPSSVDRADVTCFCWRQSRGNERGRTLYGTKTSKTHLLQLPRLRAEHTRPIRAKGQFEAHKVKPPRSLVCRHS